MNQAMPRTIPNPIRTRFFQMTFPSPARFLSSRLLCILALGAMPLLPVATADTLVGALPGDVSVDNKGAANYVIPIQVVPGRLGMQPDLAISYSSQGGNGIMGIGFSLSGPSSITRGRTILARDRIVDGPDFDENDKLYLDGKRLIRVVGDYFKSGSEYRTEVESFSKITAHGAVGQEPDYFKVLAKSGSILYYGNYSGATDAYQKLGGETENKAYAYALSRVEDRQGNYMTYHYDDKGQGEHVLESIDYTGNATTGTPSFATVKFEYNQNVVAGDADSDTLRDDARYGYIGGRETRTAHRLDAIAVLFGTEQVRRYELTYDYSPVSKVTRLSRVDYSAKAELGDSFDSVPPTIFQWSDYSADAHSPSLVPLRPSFDPDFDQQMYIDVNGDGKADSLDISRSESASGPGSIFFSEVSVSGAHANTVSVSGDSMEFLYAGDFDGDGLTDALWADLDFKKFQTARFNGTSFDTPTLVLEDEALFSDWETGERTVQRLAKGGKKGRISVSDFNGDGRDDILFHTFQGAVKVMLATDAGFAAPVDWLTGLKTTTAHSVVVFPTPFVFYAPPSLYIEVEVDSEGSDSKGVTEQREVVIPFRWSSPGDLDVSHSLIDYHTVSPMVADFNGDGISDYAWVEHESETNASFGGASSSFSAKNNYVVYVALARSEGGFYAKKKIASSESQLPASDFNDSFFRVFPGDFNGDGIQDMLILDSDHSTPAWSLYEFKGQNAFGAPTYETVADALASSHTLNYGSGSAQVESYNVAFAEDYWNGDIKSLNWLSYDESYPPQPGIQYSIQTSIRGQHMLARDFNFDGRTDFAWFNGKAGEYRSWLVCYAEDGGFDAPVELFDAAEGDLDGSYGGLATSIGDEVVALSLSFADLDGDGLNDWIMENPNQGRLFAISSSSKGDMLQTVTNGLGSKSEIRYRPITDESVYTKGSGASYPIREEQDTRHVVSDVFKDLGQDYAVTPDGAGFPQISSGSAAHFAYQYSGARTDLSGRGFLGYNAFLTMDMQSQLYSYQFLAQSFPMTGLAKREQVYRFIDDSTMRIVSSSDHTVVADEVKGETGSRLGTLFPMTTVSSAKRWEDDGNAQFSVDFDNHDAIFANDPASLTTHYSKVDTRVWFDDQDQATPFVSLPSVFANHETNPMGMDADQLHELILTPTPGAFLAKIDFGNVERIETQTADGYSTVSENGYYGPNAKGEWLPGLLKDSMITVSSPAHANEPGPSKMYDYHSGGLLRSERTATGDSGLDSTTSYTYSSVGDGHLEKTRLLGYDSSGDIRHVGQYDTSLADVSSYDATRRWAERSENAYGHWTRSVRDPIFGLPTEITDVNRAGASSSTENAYDALGRLVSSADNLLDLSSNVAYALDASVSIPVPPGAPTDSVPSYSEYKVTTTATKQPPVEVYHNRLGQVVRVIKTGFNDQKLITDTVYDDQGRVAAVSNPYPQGDARYWNVTEYDELGRVSTITAANDTVTTNTYNGLDTTTTVDASDRAPQTTVAQTNQRGETVKIWNPDPASGAAVSGAPSIEYELDGFGRMRATYLRGNGGSRDNALTVSATYDILGSQLSLTDPDKGHWIYLYDGLGRLVRQTDAKDNVTENRYDQLNRQLTRITTDASDNSTETASFHFYDTRDDSARNAVSSSDYGWVGLPQRDELVFDHPTADTEDYEHVFSRYYDRKGRIEFEITQVDDRHYYAQNRYDAFSRLDTRSYAWRDQLSTPAADDYQIAARTARWSQYALKYAYDPSYSYVQKITDSQGKDWWEAHATAGYDAYDAPALFQKGEALWTERRFFPKTRLLQSIKTGLTVSSSSLQNHSYSWDDLGNLKSRGNGSRSETFGYDHLNRLTTRNSATIAAYDPIGNILNKKDVSGIDSGPYVYGSKPHAVASAHGYAMTYDANGNMATRTKAGETWTFSWNAFDKPRFTAKGQVGSAFRYGANRQRAVHLKFDSISGTPIHYTEKKVYAGSDFEADYLNQASGAETNWELKSLRVYVNAPDGRAGAYEFHPADAGFASKRYLYHHDHLGSVDKVTELDDTSGSAALDYDQEPADYSYDPWGQRRDPSDWNGLPIGFSDGDEGDLTPRGFTDHEMLDHLGGLVHMNGRIYDPLLGRFLSADQKVDGVATLQGFNRYSYVHNNPLTLIDPDGYAAFALHIPEAVRTSEGGVEALQIIGAGVSRSALGGIGDLFALGLRINATISPVSLVFPEYRQALNDAASISETAPRNVLSDAFGTDRNDEEVAVVETVADIVGGVKALPSLVRGLLKNARNLLKLGDETVQTGLADDVPVPNPIAQSDEFADGVPASNNSMSNVRAKGEQGEAMQLEKIKAEGETLTGQQVTFKTSTGKRTRIDATTTDGTNVIVREAKNGPGAKLSPGQKQLKADVEAGRTVEGRGKRAREAGLEGKVTPNEFKEDRF